MYHKYLPCQNFKSWLWREVRLFELRILVTIARHYSIQTWPSSKERVGSKDHLTSSNQDIKTNVATLVWRRGVRGSCFILRRVFLSTLAMEKNMPSSRWVVLIGWRHNLAIWVIADVFLTNLPGLFLHKNSVSWPKFTDSSFLVINIVVR